MKKCLKIHQLSIIKIIKTSEKYPSLSKEEKEKKQQYGCERYKNILEDEEQKLVEYRKKI